MTSSTCRIFAAVLVAMAIAVAPVVSGQTPKEPSAASFCPTADVGPASDSGSGFGAMPPPLPTGGGNGSAAAHVGALRAQLGRATTEFLEASVRLLGHPRGPASLAASEAGAHVSRLRAELQDLVVTRMTTPLAADVELAARAASIDALLERIHAYERAYGRGPGEATTLLNALTVTDIKRALSAVAAAQDAAAFEIARTPLGAVSVDLELRWRELGDLRTQLDGEATLRASQPQPRLLTIATKDSRTKAIALHASIAAVDADAAQDGLYAAKLALHVELRAAGRPNDAALAALREDVIKEVRKTGSYDSGRAVVASFRGRRPPNSDPFSGPPPTPPNPPPVVPKGPAPAQSDPLTGLTHATLEEAAAVRTRSIERVARARGALAADISIVRAALSEDVYFDGVELAALTDAELTTLGRDYERWLGHLAVEGSGPDARVRVQLEITAAEQRLKQVKAILAIRAGTGWRGALGASAPARAPPVNPDQLSNLIRSSASSPSVVAARALAPVVAAQSESSALAGRVGEPNIVVAPTVSDAVVRARVVELQEQQKVLQGAMANLEELERRLLGAPSATDAEARRYVVAARATIAQAVHAHKAEVAQFRATGPVVGENIGEVRVPPGWIVSGSERPASTLSLLRECLIATETARWYANGRLMTPVVIAKETALGLDRASRISLARLGVVASSESTDFEKLFPHSAAWTKNRVDLGKVISRLPGGVIVDATLPESVARLLTNVHYDSESRRIAIAYGGRLLRTDLQMGPAEFRDALAFALDQRVVAVDIRGLKNDDVRWMIANALPFPLTALTPDEGTQLLRELGQLSSINLHPELEHGPWAAQFIEADQVIFNVLPYQPTPTAGDLQFKGLPLQQLRNAFRRDQQEQFNVAFIATPEHAPRKSVLTFASASLRCAGDHVAVEVGLTYDVYQSDQRMPETSAWLTGHDAEIRARTPAIREAARFATLQSLLRASLTARKQSVSAAMMVRPPEPNFTPKFLCSAARVYANDCAFRVLGRMAP